MNLEDKLRKMEAHFYKEGEDVTLGGHRGVLAPETIAQILQAIKDEGYRLDPFQPVNVYADEKGELHPRPPTGQEFYERFKAELWQPPKQDRIRHDDDGESHARFYRTGGQLFMLAKALEAARRAAGL